MKEPFQNRPDDLRDAALMLRVREGDTAAFERLYNRYHRKVQDYFYAMSKESETAKDLCHETFMRIWRLRDRYTDSGSFPGYLFSFARRVWLERCRGLKKERKLGLRIDTTEAADRLGLPPGNDPDAAASNAEMHDRIFAAVEQLPEEQRTVFVMRVVQRMKLDAIAEALGCPVNTVRSRKLAAVRKLRELLKDVMVL